MKFSKSWAKENFAILFFLSIQSIVLVGSIGYIIYAEIESRFGDGNDNDIVYEHISVEPLYGKDIILFANAYNSQYGSEKEIVTDQVDRAVAIQSLISGSSKLAFLSTKVSDSETSGFSPERLPLIQQEIDFAPGDSIPAGYLIYDQFISKSGNKFCQMFEPQKMKEFINQMAKVKQSQKPLTKPS